MSGLPDTALARRPASKVIQSCVSIRSCGSSRAIRSAIAAYRSTSSNRLAPYTAPPRVPAAPSARARYSSAPA